MVRVRLQTNCHSPIYVPLVPMEEIVRAFNFVIDKGWAFYWGTSEWSAREIEEAYRAQYLFSVLDSVSHLHADVADRLGLQGPIAEQCQHQYVFFSLRRPAPC